MKDRMQKTSAFANDCPQRNRTESEMYGGVQTFIWMTEDNIVEVPFDKEHLLEVILSPDNFNKAYLAVVRNKGCGGIDKMPCEQLLPWLKANKDERNHPKSTVLFKFFALPYFAGKKAMFNLNENNRIVMSQHPSDMRIGVNGMCGQVRKVGLDPSNGDVYIFVGRSRQLMKILHWERGGYVMYYKRLEQGRFHPRIFLREGIGFRTMRWDELVLLMEGISPKVARRKRFPNPNGKLELSRKK